jgi:hypothetical protein
MKKLTGEIDGKVAERRRFPHHLGRRVPRALFCLPLDVPYDQICLLRDSRLKGSAFILPVAFADINIAKGRPVYVSHPDHFVLGFIPWRGKRCRSLTH